MSKIYEALELEHRKQKGVTDPVPHSDKSPTTSLERRPDEQPVIWRNTDPEIEEEFINLYYTIHSLLNQKRGKVVQFVGSSEGDGTSSIVEEFGRVSTAELGKSVLLLRAHTNGHGGHHHPDEPMVNNLERLSNGA